MKKLFIASLLFSGSYFFYACNGNSSNTSSSTSDSTSMMSTDTTGNMGTKMDSTKTNTNTAMIDDQTKDFTAKAASGGMMEVELGNLAEQKGSSQAVKDFGKMMVDDHSKINDKLKGIASDKNITLPATVTSDQRKDIDKLSKKSGADFDKDYVNMMIDDHKKDISEFKKAEEKVSDNDIKTFITNALPTLQKHLDAVENIKKKM